MLLYLTVGTSAQSPQYENLALQLSPNGETIAVGTYYGELILYDAVSRNTLHTFQHEADIYDLEWSPDGVRIAAVSYFGNVKVWDTVSYELLFSIDLPLNIVFRVNWSPDGTQLARTSAESGTTLLDSTTGSELFHLQTGDTADSLWFPSTYLMTAGLVGLRVWNGEIELSRILGTVNGVINSNLPSRIAFSSTLNSIAVYGNTAPTIDSAGNITDSRMVLQTYAFPAFELLNSINLSLPEQTSVIKLEWSENGAYIAMSTTDGYLGIWDGLFLTPVNEIFVASAGWAFDWLNDTEIIFAPNHMIPNTIQVVIPPPPTPSPTATPTLTPSPTATLTPIPTPTSSVICCTLSNQV